MTTVKNSLLYIHFCSLCVVYWSTVVIKVHASPLDVITLIYSCFGLRVYETVLLVGRNYQFGGTLLPIHQEYGVTRKTTIWTRATAKSSDLCTVLVSYSWTHNTVLSSSKQYFVVWWFLKGLVLVWLLRNVGFFIWMSNYFSM